MVFYLKMDFENLVSSNLKKKTVTKCSYQRKYTVPATNWIALLLHSSSMQKNQDVIKLSKAYFEISAKDITICHTE